MLLAIDSGNTNTVFAVYDKEGQIVGEWRSSTNTNRTADEYGVWLTQLMQIKNFDPKGIKAAIISTVVPAGLFSLRVLCRNYFHCEPVVVGEPNVDLGIKVLTDRPEEVGADRLVNAVAAQVIYGAGPKIIIDFGTATTFDYVDTDGNYQGGIIAPGVNLSLEALHQAAAKLPRVAIGRPETVIGKGTVEAMKSGVFLGYVSMIEGLVDRINKEIGYKAKVIATGGLAALFSDATDAIDVSNHDLTLLGLLYIHQRYSKKA